MNMNMNIGQLLMNLNPEEKQVIRKLEKINYKINAAVVAKTFNQTNNNNYNNNEWDISCVCYICYSKRLT